MAQRKRKKEQPPHFTLRNVVNVGTVKRYD